MDLKINGEQKQSSASTLEELLIELNIPLDGIAVAVNEEVISKQHWNSSSLKQNDAILIITATQGG